MVVRPVREVAVEAHLSDPQCPAVSVVMPCLNEKTTLHKTLVSLEQFMRGVEFEVIAVDGGSSDETCSLLKDFELFDISVLASTVASRAAQMNQGAAIAKGDLLLFLHADTQLLGNAEVVFKEFVISQKDWGFFKLDFDCSKPKFRFLAFMINHRSRLSGISTGDQCQFVKREVFEGLGGFSDQDLMEDIELSKDLKRMSAPFRVHSGAKVVTSARRWQAHGFARTIWLMWKLRFLYFMGASPSRLNSIYRSS
jgi:rSAM/selenodomain-associated transferase 2